MREDRTRSTSLVVALPVAIFAVALFWLATRGFAPRSLTGGKPRANNTATIVIKEWSIEVFIEPLQAGENALTVVNKGKQSHRLAVKEASGKFRGQFLGRTRVLKPGETLLWRFTAPPEVLTFYDDLGDNESRHRMSRLVEAN